MSHGSSFLDQFPVTDYYELSSGAICPVPFVCRDADTLVLHGTVNIAPLRGLLRGDKYVPVSTHDERGFAALWFVDYRDTSVGAFNEVVLSFLTSATDITINYQSAMDLLAASARPDVVTYGYRQYLDQQIPIDYGREVHGMAKHRRPQSIAFRREGATARFELICDGTSAVRGTLDLPEGQAAAIRSSMLFVTPSNELFQTRTVFHTELVPLIRPRKPSDELTLSADTELGSLLTELQFDLNIVQYSARSRFVMLKPQNWRPAKDAVEAEGTPAALGG